MRILKDKADIRDHVAAVLREVSIAELDELLELAEQNERNRLTFWTTRLQEMSEMIQRPGPPPPMPFERWVQSLGGRITRALH